MLNPFSMRGKVGIVAGLANQDSIAFGCAQALHHTGATCLVTYASPSADDAGASLTGLTHYVDAGHHLRF